MAALQTTNIRNPDPDEDENEDEDEVKEGTNRENVTMNKLKLMINREREREKKKVNNEVYHPSSLPPIPGPSKKIIYRYSNIFL